MKKEGGSRELIPYETERFAVALDKEPKVVIGLDAEGMEIGKAKGELRDGLYHIQPVTGAVSYRVGF